MNALGGLDLGRALGANFMVVKLYRRGWTGEQVREFTEDLKGDGIEVLERFAGGALAEIKGTPLYPVMLELTAIRYALWTTESRGFEEPKEPVAVEGPE